MVKRYSFITLFVFIIMFVLSSKTLAIDPYMWGSVGGNQYISLSFGVSARMQNSGQSSWGLELGWLNNAQISKGDYLDYYCPHYDYTTLGWRKEGSTVGLDILYLQLLQENIIAYGGIGLYASKYVKIARSNLTGWWYNHGVKSEISIPFSLGIRLVEEKYFLGLGYHEERGINAQIGFNLRNK